MMIRLDRIEKSYQSDAAFPKPVVPMDDRKNLTGQ